jgi:DNA polymerase
MSNLKFADVLRMLGVEPPTKISPRTSELTYAFSRQDEEFTDLLEHDNILVRTAVEARLEVKSTIEETRTRRFITISELEFPHGTGYMPMPVIVGAAHTHRVGGGWDLNVQNLGRGSKLRDALYADDGYILLVVDSKQIEARFVAWFCDQADLVEAFRAGRDVYADFASEVFGFKVNAKEHPIERFIGKTAVLQLGYASGWAKFQNTIRVQSRNTPIPIELSDDHARSIVSKYRLRYNYIPRKWNDLNNVLPAMEGLGQPGKSEGYQMKCVRFYKDLMVGPTGLPVRFPNLRYIEVDEESGGSWWFDDGKKVRRTYGASLLETIAQHCARCIVMGAAARLVDLMDQLAARLVHTAHDELVYMVPVEQIEAAKIWAQTEMNRPPAWAPGLPLDCDLGVAERYGDAK